MFRVNVVQHSQERLALLDERGQVFEKFSTVISSFELKGGDPAEVAAMRGYLSAVEIEAEKVADGIYMLTGSGGNMGLSVGQDGAYLIDDQYAPLTGKILADWVVHGSPPRVAASAGDSRGSGRSRAR